MIAVDLNDAPAGHYARPVPATIIANCPAATGVIPIKQFLDALVQIGFDGCPIQAEPFNAALRALPLDQACAAASVAMKKAFSTV